MRPAAPGTRHVSWCVTHQLCCIGGHGSNPCSQAPPARLTPPVHPPAATAARALVQAAGAPGPPEPRVHAVLQQPLPGHAAAGPLGAGRAAGGLRAARRRAHVRAQPLSSGFAVCTRTHTHTQLSRAAHACVPEVGQSLFGGRRMSSNGAGTIRHTPLCWASGVCAGAYTMYVGVYMYVLAAGSPDKFMLPRDTLTPFRPAPACPDWPLQSKRPRAICLQQLGIYRLSTLERAFGPLRSLVIVKRHRRRWPTHHDDTASGAHTPHEHARSRSAPQRRRPARVPQPPKHAGHCSKAGALRQDSGGKRCTSKFCTPTCDPKARSRGASQQVHVCRRLHALGGGRASASGRGVQQARASTANTSYWKVLLARSNSKAGNESPACCCVPVHT